MNSVDELMRLVDEHGAERWATGVAEQAKDKRQAVARDREAQEVREAIRSLASRMAAPPQQWQPIETAPKDGTHMLLWVQTRWGKKARALPLAGYWLGFWVIVNADEAVQRVEASHWKPIDAPPLAAAPAEQEPK